ncbi:MAG: hypothetical protein IT324_29340 [Anaerolineae bacterium]|nr:hypothetical protein [Anaerolineae bacterium]
MFRYSPDNHRSQFPCPVLERRAESANIQPCRSGRGGFNIRIAVLALLLAGLACTSADTNPFTGNPIIQLTATPVPTITPTPLAIQTRFKVGDQATTVSATFQMILLDGPLAPGGAAASNALCFPNTSVKILTVSRNRTDTKDPHIYYEIECGASQGWVPEYWITPLTPNGSATVKSPDGKGAPVYSSPDIQSKPVDGSPCADGTKVSVDSLTANPNSTDAAPDLNIYVQTTCGSASGYMVDSMLVPAS